MITEIIRYVTDDGTEHRTLGEAETHEATRALADELFKQGLVCYDEAHEVARYLQRRYILTPKEQT